MKRLDIFLKSRTDGGWKLNQPITDFLRSPEFDVELDHAFIQVGHLLTMTSGLSWAEGGVDEYNNWVVSGDRCALLIPQ